MVADDDWQAWYDFKFLMANLGRNLAIAGALCTAFQYGFNFAYWDGGWEDGKGVPHPKISILQG